MKASDRRPAFGRLAFLDALRGAAVLAMIAYHFGFDLNTLGWLHQDLNHDWRWLTARALILGSFLFVAGAGVAFAEARNTPLKTQLLRIARIAAAALLVTAGSWLAFPKSAIYFGTLHAIAAMGLAMLAVPRGVWPACALGVTALVFGNLYSSNVFDQPALAWLGLMTHKPVTEDYVPLLPWFGVCLIGYGAAHSVIRRPSMFNALARPARKRQRLAWIGRHSLVIYLLHQPLLLGILIPLTRLLRP